MLDAFTSDYATTNGTAVAGQHYAETRGTLEFAAGEMMKSVTVPVFDNGIEEPDKRFQVLLSNPSDGRALGTGTATVTLCDTTGKRPHTFGGIHVGADGTVTLQVSGGVAKRFQPFFDIHVLEVSDNLRGWTPLTWLVRTNTATNVLTYLDPDIAQSSSRFYRVQAALAIAPWPPPTGPYPVGRVDRLLADPTRRNRYAISTNGSFMLSIWYPAVRPAGAVPATFEDDALARDPNNWVGWVDRVLLFRSYSVVDAPFVPGLSRCPVVLFSTGLNNYRKDAVDRFELLASHGFVVMAVDHYDTWFTVFPDGTYPPGTAGRDLSTVGFRNRVQDFLFLLDQMTRWNDEDRLLAGKLDVTNVGAMGFSWGGGVVAELCRLDARCRAAALFEGTFQEAGQVAASGLSKPTLEMNASAGMGSGTLFGKAKQDAIVFQISNTSHASFSGTYFWPDASTIVQGREAARTMNDWALWFFKKYLRGSSEPMPAVAEYPRIINFKQK